MAKQEREKKAEGSTEKKVIDEISEKASDYENKMTQFMSECVEWADLYKVKPPARKDKTFSNPRQTEFFRAANAVGTLTYRMMTAADPFFMAQPVDINPDYDALETLTHTWKTQIKYAKYRPALLRACHFAPVFGTVIAQLDYRVIGVSQFGRRVPVTMMIPRVLDQIMFDRGTMSIDEADWVATADVTSAVALKRLAQEADELGTPWNPKALAAAAEGKEEGNTINDNVKQRLLRSGFSQDDALKSKKELLMYYGKLDALNDGMEYVCALVNRKYLVRFHANTFQHGKRPFVVGKWQDFDTALGYGMGQLLGNSHRAMDANRQKAQDLLSFGAYNMWKRRRNTVADEVFVARPLQILDVDNMDDIMPLSPDMRGAEGILRLDEILKAEFRAASGASDTLQAIANEATSATASALSQNEGLRAASVHAEMLADPLVREYLEINHANNLQNIRAPFNINKAGVASRVYPMDLRMDVDIEAKVTTDKDFRPQRLDKLIQTLQILVSTKSQHPDQMQISVLPLVKEIAYCLEVNPQDIIQSPGAMPMAQGMGAGDMGGLAQMMGPGGEPQMAGGVAPVNTPVGQVLAA